MKPTRPWITVALAWSLCGSACATPPSTSMADIVADQPFLLRLGAVAQWPAGGLQVGFEAVTADSRCATGTQCVWAGDATVRLWVRHRGGAKDVRELHTNPQAANAKAVMVGDVMLTLVSLEPHPVGGQALDKAAYAATLVVRRTSPVGTPTETPSDPVPGASQADR